MSWTGQLDPVRQHFTGHFEIIETLGFVAEFDWKIVELAR